MDMMGSLHTRYAKKSRVDYSCEDSDARYIGRSQESRSRIKSLVLLMLLVRSGNMVKLKTTSVDTGGIDINALIDGSGIVLTNRMIGESILELYETNATDESIKSYEKIR